MSYKKKKGQSGKEEYQERQEGFVESEAEKATAYRNLGTVYKISKLLYGKCTKVKKTVKKVKLPKLGRGMAPSVHQSVSRVSHSLCYLFKASPSHQDGDSHWLRQEQAGLRKGRG